MLRLLLEALAAVHASGFAHRDVRPGNVLFRGAAAAEGLVLIDFGHAAPFAGSGSRGVSGPCGSDDYSAPEVR